MPFSQSQQPLYEIKAGLFKGLSHPIRVRVLEVLCDGAEHSVAELQHDTELEASHLSQHLAVLRRQHLVVSERRASHVYYRVAWPEVTDLLRSARALLVQVVTADGQRANEIGSLPELQR